MTPLHHHALQKQKSRKYPGKCKVTIREKTRQARENGIINWSTTKSQKGTVPRCPEGYAFPGISGMSHPLQMFHGNHLIFGKCKARYQSHKIGENADRLEIHYAWLRFRMSFNLCEIETSHSLLRSPYQPSNFLKGDFKRSTLCR